VSEADNFEVSSSLALSLLAKLIITLKQMLPAFNHQEVMQIRAVCCASFVSFGTNASQFAARRFIMRERSGYVYRENQSVCNKQSD
jgi:hypothetical protein